MDIFFDKIERYEDPSTILFRSIELALIKKKFSKLFKNKKILDFGCGEGIAASAVFDKQVYWGVDNEQTCLKSAKREKIYKKLIFADGVNVPIKKSTVDLVFANCVIEHIKDLDGALENINNMLKKNGLFIFTTPSADYKNWNIFSYLRLGVIARIYGNLRDKKFNHYNCNNLTEWGKTLKKYGFEVKKSFYYIDKKTMEKWDYYWLIQFVLRVVSRKLVDKIYRRFWRHKIFNAYQLAKELEKGAGICILAKKLG